MKFSLAVAFLIYYNHQAHAISTNITQQANETQKANETRQKNNITPNDLRWDHTPEMMMEQADKTIHGINQIVAQIVAPRKEKRTFADTFLTWAKIERDLEFVGNNIGYYHNASPNKVLIDKSYEVQTLIHDFETQLEMREDIYNAFVKAKKDMKKSGEWDTLTKEQQTYIKKTIEGREREGMNLDQKSKKRVIQLKRQVRKLALQQYKYTRSATAKVKFTKKQMRKIPRSLKSRFEKVKGHSRTFKISADQFKRLFHSGQKAKMRRRLYKKFHKLLVKKNMGILQKLIQTRRELANLLGYNSYSDYILEEAIAHDVQTVQKFQTRLVQSLITKAHEDFSAAQALMRKKTRRPNAKLKPWDTGYYCHKLKKQRFGRKSQAISHYFPVNHVIKETLSIYQELLGLDFKELQDVQVWHPDVRVFEVKDNQTHQLLGHFYLDLYARKHKKSHGSVTGLIRRSNLDGKYIPAAAVLNSGFSKGKGQTQQPTLLFKDVKTFFHEFGHLMHNLCSLANYTALSGTKVERDFVEMPSQMLENWIWEESIMKRLSKHVETGESLPTEIITNKINSQKVCQAYELMRQLQIGTYDLLINSVQESDVQKTSGSKKMKKCRSLNFFKDPQSFNMQKIKNVMKFKNGKIDLNHFWAKLSKEFQFVDLPKGTNPAAMTGHLFGHGYASRYYGYLWSKVYSIDLFQKFKKEGIMNQEFGRKYRQEILAPSGTRSSMEGLKALLGREPTEDAYFNWLGI